MKVEPHAVIHPLISPLRTEVKFTFQSAWPRQAGCVIFPFQPFPRQAMHLLGQTRYARLLRPAHSRLIPQCRFCLSPFCFHVQHTVVLRGYLCCCGDAKAFCSVFRLFSSLLCRILGRLDKFRPPRIEQESPRVHALCFCGVDA